MVIQGFKPFDLLESLGICSCGSPALAYKEVHSMLRRAADSNPAVFVVDIPDDHPAAGYVYYMAYILDYIGYLEHGSAITSAHLTPKGKALLELLDMMEPHGYEYAETADGHPVFIG